MMNSYYFRDVFEELREKVMCDYLSNLKYMPWKKAALDGLSTMDLSQYPLHSLNELAEYMFGEKQRFDSAEEADRYFGGKLAELSVG